MSVVDMIIGTERVGNVELKSLDWYAPYSKCPIQYNPGPSTLGMQRITGLQKLNVAGPTGASIKKINNKKLPYLNPDHNHPAVQQSVTGWQEYAFDCPDGLIIRMNLSACDFSRPNGLHVANLFFRIRETGPLMQVRFKDGHGLPYLIKGRMDRLSDEFILKNKLITMSAMNSILQSHVDTFLVVDELAKAEVDLEALGTKTITVDGHQVQVARNRKVRKVSL